MSNKLQQFHKKQKFSFQGSTVFTIFLEPSPFFLRLPSIELLLRGTKKKQKNGLLNRLYLSDLRSTSD